MRPLPVLVVLIGVLLLAPGLAAQESADGHWEQLGEDGAIWVPDGPVAFAPPPADLGTLHNYAEMTAALQALALRNPDTVALASLGKSVEGRDVWSVTLRAGADNGRPAVLYDGAHHGDEVIASDILLRYAQDLADNYPASARSRAILENVTIVLVPMVNPDGIERAQTAPHYAEARKNANGVDLNRNYAYAWGGTGSSGSPSDATYRGPAPASEPETKVMQTLLASREWTFYSSLHSGAEMILWPWGWTTTPPPESALYQSLGNELTAITGAPNGQVSRILYGVSGDSMDHAYAAAGSGWRPIATSPETYGGSGNAFDWWLLFNPPDSQVPTVVARWTAFLDHLAVQAPAYAPARLQVPTGIVAGGDPFTLEATLATSAKRPVLGASALLSPPPFAGVATQNPVGLGTVNGTASASWTLVPASGGEGAATVRVSVGPAGNLSASVPVRVTAPGVSISLDRARAGSGETVTATVTALSDVPLAGNATVLFLGRPVDARNVTLDGASAATWSVSFDVGDAPAGARGVEVVMDYATADGSGTVRASASLVVDRPQLAVARSSPATVMPGEAFLMTVTVRNTGNLAARGIVVSEVVPEGYALLPRDAGVPVPADPLARPAPKRASLTDDGRVALEWDVLGIVPNGTFSYQVRLMPIVPGDHELETRLAYQAQYPGRTYAYSERATQDQTVG